MRTQKLKTVNTKVTATQADRLFVDANSAWDRGDLITAYSLFTKSAELGDTGSQLDLGYFFHQGLFVRRNEKKAIEWYYKAYQNGNPGGANNIATVYRELGKRHKMFWWFRRAAEMGDSAVQLDLAHRYENGSGLPRNLKMALRFYRQVLDNGAATKEEKSLARIRVADISRRSLTNGS